MSEHKDYLLGSDDVELARLEEQHVIWEPHWQKLMDSAAYGQGHRVIDLGAGPGFASISLAERVGPSGQVVAVDTSSRFADHLTRLMADRGLSQVQFQKGDVHDLKDQGETYDGAWARWLFCFLKDPEQVVRQVAQALRPGAIFTVMDYCNYQAAAFCPNHPSLKHAWKQTYLSFRDSGGNLDICDVLPGILESNGFEVTHLQPILELARPGSAHWNWYRGFRESFYPKLVENGYLTKEEERAHWNALRDVEATPGSFFFTPPMMGIVARKR